MGTIRLKGNKKRSRFFDCMTKRRGRERASLAVYLGERLEGGSLSKKVIKYEKGGADVIQIANRKGKGLASGLIIWRKGEGKNRPS